jgi:LPPG:FO 2-phospho-L-lactate transferase
MPQPKILAIAGGVGGAKLALGLARLLPPGDLTVVVNTGDDEIFHGLHVSPDLDSVTYALAGLTNPDTGWGVAGDSFRTLEALGRLGAETWFGLGDLDFATHIRRTALLGQGRTLSEATAEITRHLGIACAVAPMTDASVRTIALTDAGELAFQEYFVHRGCEPRISGVRFDGAEDATASPAFADALASADAIVYCPSNPLVSVGPILAVPGVRDAIANFAGPRIAVSPIVGGQALKGPAAKMMEELGEEVSCVGVARRYVGLCDALVIDDVDAEHVSAIADCGMRAVVAGTIMQTEADKIRLAQEILDLVANWTEDGEK